MSDTVFINARLLDPETAMDTVGGVHISGRQIIDLGPHISEKTAAKIAKAKIIDCKNLCLAPGLVDIRVQLREPGEEHKEVISTAVEAALAGGVTSMICLPNTMPVIDDISVVEFISRRGREVKGSRIYCYGAATKGLGGKYITEFGLLKKSGVCGFSDGEKTITDSKIMACAMRYAKGVGMPIIQHAQDVSLAEEGVMNEGELSMRLGLQGIPAQAEVIIIERDIRLLEMIGGHYHIAHLSTAAGLEAVKRAKKAGLHVTCETAPHYFTLNEYAVGEYRTFAKVTPPLQSEQDRQAILEGLKDGTIDCIVSDHSPQDQDSKRLPFDLADFGMIGLETLLPISLELYHNDYMKLLDVIALLSLHPARIMGLKGGRLCKGERADLILFDLEKRWIIKEEAMRSKSKNTPFEGREVQSMIVQSWVDGRCVFGDTGEASWR